MSNMFKPKISNQTPAAAPTIKPLETPQRELGGSDNEREEALRRRRGRNGLRIDPQTGGVSRGGGSGINIPMK